MKRPYQDQAPTEQVTFFIGTEVESTPARGCRTLFVVGVQSPERVLALAEEHEVEQIYLGANQSFDVGDWKNGHTSESDNWVAFVDAIANSWTKWFCLDFDVQDLEWVLEGGWSEYNNFIPMISVKMPYIRQLNVNAVLKLDDLTFQHSNTGVWCHRVSDLTHSSGFTHWLEYTKDQSL